MMVITVLEELQSKIQSFFPNAIPDNTTLKSLPKDQLQNFIRRCENEMTNMDEERSKIKEELFKEYDNNLQKAKQIIAEYYSDARCGIFDNRDYYGDLKTNIYNKNGLTIDICYHWEYFEVFGLSSDKFAELKKYYEGLMI